MEPSDATHPLDYAISYNSTLAAEHGRGSTAQLRLLAAYEVDPFESDVCALDQQALDMPNTQTAELAEDVFGIRALNARGACSQWLLHAAKHNMLPDTHAERVQTDGHEWRRLRSLRMALGMLNVAKVCARAWDVEHLRALHANTRHIAKEAAYRAATLFGFSIACVTEKYKMWHLCQETESALDSIDLLFSKGKSPHHRSSAVRSFMLTSLRSQGVQRPFMGVLGGCRGDWLFDGVCDHRDYHRTTTGCVVCGARVDPNGREAR